MAGTEEELRAPAPNPHHGLREGSGRSSVPRLHRRATVPLGLLVVAGCTAAIGDEPPVVVRVPSPEVIIGGGRGGVAYEDLGIPPGHMPPPGACRIWYPDRPPGQQPPPGRCDVYPPPGAVLVRGR